MGQVSDAMRKLIHRDVKAKKDGKLSIGSSGMLTKYLPTRTSSATKAAISQAIAEGKEMIAPVAAFHLRNATHVAYHQVAGQEDRQYMAEQLPLGYIQALAVTYISSHLATNTLRWYVFFAILVALTPIRRRISSLRHQDCDDWSVLRMEVILQLEDVLPLFSLGINSVFAWVLPPAVLKSQSYAWLFASVKNPSPHKITAEGGQSWSVYIAGVVIALVGRIVLDIWQIGSLPVVMEKYQRLLFHVTSAFTALLLRTVLLVVIYGLRSVMRGVLWSISKLARCTFYRKGVRKLFRRLRKKMTRDSTGPFLAPGSYLAVIFCSIPATVIALSFMTGHSNRLSLGSAYWALLVFYLGVTASTWAGVLRSLLIPPYEVAAKRTTYILLWA